MVVNLATIDILKDFPALGYSFHEGGAYGIDGKENTARQQGIGY